MRYVAYLALLACSSSNDFTSVDRSKVLWSLAEADVARLCTDLRAYDRTQRSSRVAFACTRKALSESASLTSRAGSHSIADLRASCKQLLATCIADAPALPEGTCDDMRAQLECEATVGEFSDCLAAMATKTQQVLDLELCDQLDGNNSIALLGRVDAGTEACAIFISTCSSAR